MATALRDDLDLEDCAWFPPTQARPGMVIVMAAGSDASIDFRPGGVATYCSPARSFRAVLIAGPADWQDAFEWLDDVAERVPGVCAARPTLGGLVNSWSVERISEPQLWDNAMPSIEITFRPLTSTQEP